MTPKKQPPITTTTIGRAEAIQLVDYGPLTVVAKVDTGADISSLGVSDIVEIDGRLAFKLLSSGHPDYSGEVITLEPGSFSKTRIANSFGQREIRYVIKLRVKLMGRLLRGTFSLADRSTKLYPVLIGRRLLKGKFIVDVSAGDPLHAEEKARQRKIQLELGESSDRLGA